MVLTSGLSLVKFYCKNESMLVQYSTVFLFVCISSDTCSCFLIFRKVSSSIEKDEFSLASSCSVLAKTSSSSILFRASATAMIDSRSTAVGGTTRPARPPNERVVATKTPCYSLIITDPY